MITNTVTEAIPMRPGTVMIMIMGILLEGKIMSMSMIVVTVTVIRYNIRVATSAPLKWILTWTRFARL
jgi:hypothetical protein